MHCVLSHQRAGYNPMSALSPRSPCFQLSQDKNCIPFLCISRRTQEMGCITNCEPQWDAVYVILGMEQILRLEMSSSLRRFYRRSMIMISNIYFVLPLQESCGFRQQQQKTWTRYKKGFPSSSDSKASAYNAGDLGSVPGLRRSSGGGNGNPLQYSCLESSMDRGAW